MDASTKPRLTVEQVGLSSEYRLLTKKMQTWARVYIQHFIDTGTWDPLKATQAAFTSANLNVARVTSWRVKRHPLMKDVLDLFINSRKTPLELDLEEIQRHLDACDPGSIAAVKLLATKRRLKAGLPAEPEAEKPAKTSEQSKPAAAEPTSRIPVGARGIYDKTTGALLGYKAADGSYVRLAEVKAEIRS
jgi:hypothetical protein